MELKAAEIIEPMVTHHNYVISYLWYQVRTHMRMKVILRNQACAGLLKNVLYISVQHVPCFTFAFTSAHLVKAKVNIVNVC